MTDLLERAFLEAAKLPEDEQDALANWLLSELESDRRWQKQFADSEAALEQLADEALAEYRAGDTKALDPDKL